MTARHKLNAAYAAGSLAVAALIGGAAQSAIVSLSPARNSLWARFASSMP